MGRMYGGFLLRSISTLYVVNGSGYRINSRRHSSTCAIFRFRGLTSFTLAEEREQFCGAIDSLFMRSNPAVVRSNAWTIYLRHIPGYVMVPYSSSGRSKSGQFCGLPLFDQACGRLLLNSTPQPHTHQGTSVFDDKKPAEQEWIARRVVPAVDDHATYRGPPARDTLSRYCRTCRVLSP